MPLDKYLQKENKKREKVKPFRINFKGKHSIQISMFSKEFEVNMRAVAYFNLNRINTLRKR